MKFGKRRWAAKLEAQAEDDASPDAPVAESWNVRADSEPSGSVPPPAHEAESEAETVVDGEAVELPVTEVAADDPAAVAEPLDEPVPDVAPEPESEYTPVPAADIEPEPAAPPEPVVAPPPRAPGEPLPPPGARWAPSPPPPPMPFPVAEEPVLVYTSGSESPAVAPLAETGEAYASGHAGTSPSWPEPVVALAAERPEVVVGAAFAGGLLLAMILRRLGN
jgi:hypothetical protein